MGDSVEYRFRWATWFNPFDRVVVLIETRRTTAPAWMPWWLRRIWMRWRLLDTANSLNTAQYLLNKHVRAHKGETIPARPWV